MADPRLPPFSVAALFGDPRVDRWLATALLTVAVAYVCGLARLRKRGAGWPIGRTVAFLGGGVGLVGFATMSGLGTYDDTSFAVHMVQHMLLSMVAPIFLALGAPITLALRTAPKPVRRGLLAALHSRFGRLCSFPLVGWGLFVTSPFALYFTGWYPASLDNEVLHSLLHVHFLLVGCLFFWPILGIDPIPGRQPHPFRFLIVVSTLPFHAILGLSIYNQTTVIAAEHYYGLKLSWLDPVSQQRIGGGLLWSSGEIVGLIMLGVVAGQGMRASEREAVREDRRLDRLEAVQAAARLAAEQRPAEQSAAARPPAAPEAERPPPAAGPAAEELPALRRPAADIMTQGQAARPGVPAVSADKEVPYDIG